MKKRNWWLIGCGSAIAGVLLLLCLGFAGAIWLGSSVFDKEMPPRVIKVPDGTALMSAAQKIQNVAMAGMLGSMQEQTGNDTLVLELTSGEINALMQAGLATQQGNSLLAEGADQDNEPQLLNMEMVGGVLRFHVAKKLNIETPFGSWIQAEIDLVPRIRDGRIYLDTTSCTVGSLPMPRGAVQQKIAEEVVNFEQSAHGRILLRVIESLAVNDKGISIRYRPDELEKLMAEAGMGGLDIFNNLNFD